MIDRDLIAQRTEIFVKDRLLKEGTGHDWWHILRVRNNARLICKIEEANLFIIDMAILLHDVGDRKVINKPEDDYSIAERFLSVQGLSDSVITRIMFIIKNMSFSKSLNSKKSSAPIEFFIVQDADRLDAIGAIGIARAFQYGGSKGRSLYDPTQKAKNIKTTNEYQKLTSSTFHHFEEKLLLLKDLMNTNTAKKIANNRHEYMEKYIQEFLLEWSGEK